MPSGAAYWEWSCETTIARKATKDFEKRTGQTAAKRRAASTLWCSFGLGAGPARMPGLPSPMDAIPGGKQKRMRVYDATTLEEWLEEAPGVALAFAEELGDVGPGVESRPVIGRHGRALPRRLSRWTLAKGGVLRSPTV